MEYQFPNALRGAVLPERFAHDKFLLNQKVLSLGSKYHVYGETGQPLLFVDRPVFKFKAHIGIYEDDTRARKLLTVYQDSVWAIINLSFTVLDEHEQPIARLRRQGWLSILRRTWKVFDTEGHELAEAQEDSWWKALARRLPFVDILGDLLRTNFVITRPDGTALGQFIRRFTLTDKYVMDVTPDASRSLDRRLVVALAVVLDNAESR